MTTYDQHKATDEAANDADRRAEVCWWCRQGEHALCENAGCQCDVHDHYEP